MDWLQDIIIDNPTDDQEPTFTITDGVNRLFALPFQSNGGRTSYTRYYLLLVEIKDYSVMIDHQIFFDQSVKCNLITYDNI